MVEREIQKNCIHGGRNISFEVCEWEVVQVTWVEILPSIVIKQLLQSMVSPGAIVGLDEGLAVCVMPGADVGALKIL